MSRKLIIFIGGAMIVATAAMGGLFAQSSTTGVSVSAIGTAQSGATVTSWATSGSTPSWSPVQGAVGAINGGGIVHVEVPNSPAGQWSVSLMVDDPNELVQAYSFWNPKTQVRAMATGNLTAGTTNMRTFVSASGSATPADFTGGTVVNDAVTGDAYQTLTLEKGFVTFVVSSSDGLGVDGDGVYQTSAASIVSRAFEIGLSTPSGASNAGTFFTKDASTADYLSPEFTIEINQR